MTGHRPTEPVFPFVNHELVFELGDYPDVKDPALVRIGRDWHLYGTGCNARGEGGPLEILHAIAPRPSGPWRQLDRAVLDRDLGCEAAAPGVIVLDGVVHMFVQTLWSRLGGTVEHFTSADGGHFTWRDTALRSLDKRSPEAGIYDPDPCVVGGLPYLVYSGMNEIGRPDVFLARSTSGTLDGPWERRGCILRHDEIDCHNQHDDPEYEWGLEGGQLVDLPDGSILLNAVCFLRGAETGRRQRVFFAVADAVEGPYTVLGSAIDPVGGPDNGENGHGAAVVDGGRLHLLFQERTADDWHWRYRLASAPVALAARWLKRTG
ncbi:MAG TPA: hypothetical protein VNB94_14035 [Mycobacteriales bacterium]|nr:hypothetical protein [Mycobacteriales bacterium]